MYNRNIISNRFYFEEIRFFSFFRLRDSIQVEKRWRRGIWKRMHLKAFVP